MICAVLAAAVGTAGLASCQKVASTHDETSGDEYTVVIESGTKSDVQYSVGDNITLTAHLLRNGNEILCDTWQWSNYQDDFVVVGRSDERSITLHAMKLSDAGIEARPQSVPAARTSGIYGIKGVTVTPIINSVSGTSDNIPWHYHCSQGLFVSWSASVTFEDNPGPVTINHDNVQSFMDQYHFTYEVEYTLADRSYEEVVDVERRTGVVHVRPDQFGGTAPIRVTLSIMMPDGTKVEESGVIGYAYHPYITKITITGQSGAMGTRSITYTTAETVDCGWDNAGNRVPLNWYSEDKGYVMYCGYPSTVVGSDYYITLTNSAESTYRIYTGQIRGLGVFDEYTWSDFGFQKCTFHFGD